MFRAGIASVWARTRRFHVFRDRWELDLRFRLAKELLWIQQLTNLSGY